MDPRDQVVVELYLLACRKLLDHLNELRAAALSSKLLERCRKRFNEGLALCLLEGPFDTLESVAELFCDELYPVITRLRRTNPGAADILQRIVKGIREEAKASWHYLQDMDAIHEQGVALAARFYASSRYHQDHPDVFSKRAEREYRFDESDNHPMVCYPSEPRITITFTREYTLDDYLRIPFLFLHEYSAHIFARDNQKNNLFHEGWMMFAAAEFLKESWPDHYRPPALQDREQYQVFAHFQRWPLPQEMKDGYEIASRLFDDLDDWRCFLRLTQELAAFDCTTAGPVNWKNRFAVGLRTYLLCASREEQAELFTAIKRGASLADMTRFLAEWQSSRPIETFP